MRKKEKKKRGREQRSEKKLRYWKKGREKKGK
jgi:hypothetical protein